MSTAAITNKPVRKFPPPCWTRDEALVLIDAYRERWYALHRAFLKNPDWDAVAEKVTAAFPDVTPPKTPAQCRHKMEKLRQRHRAEKLRASSFPGGRFFSSWFYFEAMEAMENGSEINNQNYSNNQNSKEIGNGIVVSDHQNLNPGRGIRFKPSHVNNLVTLAANPNFDPRVSNHNFSYTTPNLSNQEDEIEDEILIQPAYKNQKQSAYGGGTRGKFSKVVREQEVDENGEMWIKVPRSTNMYQGSNKSGKSGLDEGKKRGNGGGINEVVASIKMLGDGFMKVEKMKMEMTREIERMRMETEMKRNQLMLESQKQIVEAFVKGLVETRKRTMAD